MLLNYLFLNRHDTGYLPNYRFSFIYFFNDDGGIEKFSLPRLFLHPFLLHFICDTSLDGPVVGQCDRDVGWSHGQHHSAWEEEAVITGLTFPPTIWQQVRHIEYLSFVQMGLLDAAYCCLHLNFQKSILKILMRCFCPSIF